MISHFYRTYYRQLLWLVALTTPVFWYQAEHIKSNNDIETWMPRDTGVRQVYEQFKQDFGAEEVILVGIDKSIVDARMLEAVASRMERIAGVRGCWTPERLQRKMTDMGVEPADAAGRLAGLLHSPDAQLIGLFAVLSEDGVKNRAQTVDDVRLALEYCQLRPDQYALTGAPVIVTELDRLGNTKSGRRFFILTVGVCLALLYFSLRHVGLSLSILGVTLWGIYLTQTIISVCGGEMNFILGSLSVLVMIFTLSIAVHFVSYYSAAMSEGAADPLGRAFRDSFNPCCLSTLTTLLGLVSLNVSSILPVAQFGYAAALGSVVALVVGLGVTPALLMIWPNCAVKSFKLHRVDFGWWSGCLNRYRFPILGTMAVLLMVLGTGIVRLQSDVDPVDFLPRDSKVLSDLVRVENELTNVDSIEAVVDVGGQDLRFVDQLQKVREVEALIRQHPGVRHTMSLAAFFPTEMPDSPLATARLLSKAKAQQGQDGLVADETRLWRISIRVRSNAGFKPNEVLDDIARSTAEFPIYFTGMTPLLDSAQKEIFAGFWESFTAACLTISVVMLLSLRSFVAAAIAMIPNIIPIWMVFGSVGFMGLPVDIGMMMTGSISLGISVDCTFHFLVQYKEALRQGSTPAEAVRHALVHSGEPMLDSTIICSMGMLALCFSPFAPTARFGWLMSSQMIASLLGELVLLPTMLCCLPARRKAVEKVAFDEKDASKGDECDSDVEGLIHPLPAPHLRPARPRTPSVRPETF